MRMCTHTHHCGWSTTLSLHYLFRKLLLNTMSRSLSHQVLAEIQCCLQSGAKPSLPYQSRSRRYRGPQPTHHSPREPPPNPPKACAERLHLSLCRRQEEKMFWKASDWRVKLSVQPVIESLRVESPFFSLLCPHLSHIYSISCYFHPQCWIMEKAAAK